MWELQLICTWRRRGSCACILSDPGQTPPAAGSHWAWGKAGVKAGDKAGGKAGDKATGKAGDKVGGKAGGKARGKAGDKAWENGALLTGHPNVRQTPRHGTHPSFSALSSKIRSSASFTIHINGNK